MTRRADRCRRQSTTDLDACYARCRDITRRSGTTFFLATRFFPRRRRRYVHALYALMRTADDVVDEPESGSDPSAELAALEARFHDAVVHGSADPVLAAVADTVRRCEIPPHCFERFFASMRHDLTIAEYETWDDLLGYMDGSAAAIGEMLLPVLEPTDRDAALRPARSLGLAFQLTNFLRDVGEDLDRGRQYLPLADQRRFGVRLADRCNDHGFRELMRFEIARCRRLYDDADLGLALLPRQSRLAVGAARVMYAAILDEIEASDFAVFDRRLAVSTPKRLRLLTASMTRRWTAAR